MKIELSLRPFTVPRYVEIQRKPGNRQDGPLLKNVQSFTLADLSAETLDAMCKQFRQDVFSSAGIPDPKEAREDARV